ncbi:PREDICTED: uncharacterized protein LOC109153808 [Ipomoea nil]|uniref:uncharacterized protein LOC109153808 n=1 Tax=Ipomoea nil TaxID=35883 RepID=UPI000900ED33|nr:PREDICTED: uncharacterized protein LOC109153808 [Ipomoea nil]
MKKLTSNIGESMVWKVDFNGDDGYEIKKGRQQFKVKLAGRSCSCNSWDLSGIPCPHAICAIFDTGRDPEEYIDSCYSKESYLRTYAHTLQPMNGELFWPKTQFEEILAPIPKKMAGRPKRKRNREANEVPTRQKPSTTTTTMGSVKTRVSKRGKQMHCSLCKNPGHYKRTCPNRSGQQDVEPMD